MIRIVLSSTSNNSNPTSTSTAAAISRPRPKPSPPRPFSLSTISQSGHLSRSTTTLTTLIAITLTNNRLFRSLPCITASSRSLVRTLGSPSTSSLTRPSSIPPLPLPLPLPPPLLGLSRRPPPRLARPSATLMIRDCFTPPNCRPPSPGSRQATGPALCRSCIITQRRPTFTIPTTIHTPPTTRPFITTARITTRTTSSAR
ncbi:hypothetical protein VDGD_20433 [Verticillium dahliae]|nr:hypothetical protein VDGD_20433 [Verticillium dahliae]